MNISTWKNFVIGILIVLNLAALSTIWFGHRSDMKRTCTEERHRIPDHRPDAGPHDRKPEHPQIDRVIINTLDLNEEQMRSFRTLKDEHHEKSVKLHEKVRTLKQRSFDSISAGDREEAQRIASEIGALHADMEMMLYEHFADIRSLCDEKQQERFDELLTRIGERIHPGPPQGRRPRH